MQFSSLAMGSLSRNKCQNEGHSKRPRPSKSRSWTNHSFNVYHFNKRFNKLSLFFFNVCLYFTKNIKSSFERHLGLQGFNVC